MKVYGVILLMVTLMVGSLMAEPQARKGHGHKGKGKRMAAELGLSQEQQDQMKTLWEKHRAERKDTRGEVKELRQGIATELKKSKPSKSEIKSLADKIGAIHSANAVRMADHMLEIKKVLTPEQFSKMLDKKEQRGQKKGNKKSGKGKGPGGKKQHGHQKGGSCCPQS